MTGHTDDVTGDVPGDGGAAARDEAPGHADGPRVSPLARRVGPVVAVVGVLGTVAALVWVLVAPDNVVGPLDDAPFTVAATAVTIAEDGDCLLLVAGDGTRSELCPDEDLGRLGSAWWDAEGRVVVDGSEGIVAVDPRTGAVTRFADGQRPQPSGPSRVDPEAVHTDGGVVRTGPWDADGEVVLDLGGPVARLDGAAMSPTGDLVVAVDGDGRVVVADPDRPRSVYRWFETPEGVWFDPWDGVRWEE